MNAERRLLMDRLLETLTRLPSSDGLMNPYASASGSAAADSRDEIGIEADRIRLHNLTTYLDALLAAGSKTILVGEAPGYQGCRFSGIAFSSEREVSLQNFPFSGCRLLPGAVAGTRALMKEPSAKIVWGSIGNAAAPPVLWNAVQLHPHEPGKALSNRTPTDRELDLGKESLAALVDLVQPRLIVAIGRKAEQQLARMGFEAVHVRHPARGGAAEFRKGLIDLGLASPPRQSQTSLF